MSFSQRNHWTAVCKLVVGVLCLQNKSHICFIREVSKFRHDLCVCFFVLNVDGRLLSVFEVVVVDKEEEPKYDTDEKMAGSAFKDVVIDDVMIVDKVDLGDNATRNDSLCLFLLL